MFLSLPYPRYLISARRTVAAELASVALDGLLLGDCDDGNRDGVELRCH